MNLSQANMMTILDCLCLSELQVRRQERFLCRESEAIKLQLKQYIVRDYCHVRHSVALFNHSRKYYITICFYILKTL